MKKIISILVVVFMIMSFMPSAMATANNDATLKKLYFEEVVVLNEEFSANTLSYSAYFPTEHKNGTSTCIIPELVATPNDENATVDIKLPEDITCGSYEITVTAEDGTTKLDYVISTTASGNNYCFDGGIEGSKASQEAGDTHNLNNYSCSGAQLSVETEDVYLGEKSLKVDTTSAYGSYWAQRDSGPYAYKAGIFIASEAVKLDNDETVSSAGILRLISSKQVHEYEAAEFVGTVELYDHDGTLKLTQDGARDANYSITKEWRRNYALLKVTDPTDSFSYRPYYSNWGATPTLLIDDYYFGELNATGIATVDGNKNNYYDYIVGTNEEVEITLSSKALNQLGNNIGLADAVFTYSLKNAPAGVTIENNVVTIPAGTTGSDFEVEVIADVSALNSAGQTKVKGTFPVKMLSANDIALLDAVKLPDPLVTEPAFSSDVTNYKIVVPVDVADENFNFSAAMPELIPVTSNGREAVVTTPDTIDGGVITVDVTSEGDRHSRTYNFTLEVAGESYYGNGDVESSASAWTKNSCTITPDASEVLFGTHSMKIERTGYNYTWPAFTGKKLSTSVKYLISMSIKNPEGTTIPGAYYQSWTFINSTGYNNVNWSADGTSGASTTFSGGTTTWQTNYATLQPSAEISDELTMHFTSWDPTLDAVPTLVDGNFVGELVASDVEVEYDGKDSFTLLAGGETEFSLTSKLVNQLGNQAGFGGLTPTYTIEGDHTGIEINGSTVTVNSTAKAGVYEIVANYDLSDYGTVQKGAKGTFTLNITGGDLAIEKNGNDYTVNARYKKQDTTPINAKLYIAVYEKIAQDSYKLAAINSKSATITDAMFADSVSITSPAEQGKEYIVKAFLWNTANISSLIESKTYR